MTQPRFQRPGGRTKMCTQASWPPDSCAPVLWGRLVSGLARATARPESREEEEAQRTPPEVASLRRWAGDALPRHLLLLPLPGKTSQGTLATHGCICVPQVQGCLLHPHPAMGDSGRRWLGSRGRSSAGMSAGKARSPELTDTFPPHNDTHTRCGQVGATDKRQWPR